MLRSFVDDLERHVDEPESIVVDYFFFQAEDGIRDLTVTGVQTCALPISLFTGLLGESARGSGQWCTTLRLAGWAGSRWTSANPSNMKAVQARSFVCKAILWPWSIWPLW